MITGQRTLVEESLQHKTSLYLPVPQVHSLTTMQKNELLFAIPAHTTLSPRTSSLKSLLPDLDSLDEWMQLILVMLFENQNSSSPWKQYFGNPHCMFLRELLLTGRYPASTFRYANVLDGRRIKRFKRH